MHKGIIYTLNSMIDEFYSGYELDDTNIKSVYRFRSYISDDIIADAMETALDRIKNDYNGCFSYFSGICWKRIKKSNTTFKLLEKWNELCEAYDRTSGVVIKDLRDTGNIIDLDGINIYEVYYIMHICIRDDARCTFEHFNTLFDKAYVHIK